MTDNDTFEFETEGGVKITRERFSTPYDNAVQSYVDRLDSRRGAVFSSNYEYPGRYTRWDTAMIDPPLGIVSKGRAVTIEAYNERGAVLLPALAELLDGHAHIAGIVWQIRQFDSDVAEPERRCVGGNALAFADGFLRPSRNCLSFQKRCSIPVSLSTGPLATISVSSSTRSISSWIVRKISATW